ncbi:alpha-amylase family protein [Flavobacterium ammonificans]|uniref:O-glycosyl hydrolase family 13 n=1 Tax=Flavobacterium ammonificans TaxID=1751056 RepID=A0ABN6KWJ5_9FLAO|nr:alpha-amylase family protein [Flavobacterium ammonificans]BDB53498.1 O-glycosyl hydrolase family 13 [Flavobacterium ammonificans]
MKSFLLSVACLITLSTVAQSNTEKKKQINTSSSKQKLVVYQVFTRLFGNTNTTNAPWGTIEQNGVGKFNDFTDKALQEIKDLGVSHVWYTGVPHHAVIRNYTQFGIANDDPKVVKGRAGSPYAVKDYYNVNPDLAVNPANRLQEFEALIARTHKAGLKLIIDIVPNHVARKYEGKNNPIGVSDFGADDDVTVEYHKDNNFYYIPNTSFQIPDGITPLNGENNPLIDGKFDEFPAKWTGNGSRLAKPDKNDWYETVKVNYGIRPDGTKDFPTLPAGFETKSCEDHFAFWKDKEVPNSWKKFRAIAEYWLAKGVDGFRYDMAEMVPYEFWSYMNSAIKVQRPDAFLLAEVYNPNEYRNYIHFGKMDYLYDKVELYDKLKEIVKGKSQTDPITNIQKGLADIEHHMLHFLDNHDEQRLASPEFAGSAENGKPLMVVSATISTSPTMIYFGQEVGEAGNENGGFGSHSRTSIFDYVGVPNHQRWMNGGKFDGGQLSKSEKELRDFYKKVLNFSLKSSALIGQFQEIHSTNTTNKKGYLPEMYSFVRWSDTQKLIVIANFSTSKASQFELIIPKEIIQKWHLKDGKYTIVDQLYQSKSTLKVINGQGKAKIEMKPSESFIFELK